MAAILVGLATRARLFDLAEQTVYFSAGPAGRGAGFARTVGRGAAWGAGLGVVVGVGIKILGNVLAFEDPLWELGIPAGAVIGAAFALVQWGRTPAASAPPASPDSTLRADRNLVLLLAVPFMLVIPAFFGAAFARGLDLDAQAVIAAVTLPFHNGRTEGVNTKTKMIKRQMYGRAGFTLLRHRILLS